MICLSASFSRDVSCQSRSAWLQYGTILYPFIYIIRVQRDTNTHALVYEYKCIQSHYKEARIIRRTQEHLQPLHLRGSTRNLPTHLNIHKLTHTRWSRWTHKQRGINGNQIVIMGFCETTETMAKVGQCSPHYLCS